MPLADGHEIHPSVLNGILKQSIDTILVPLSTPPSKNKRISEGVSRLRLVLEAARLSASHFCMMDRDRLLISPETFEKAIALSKSFNAMVHVHAEGRNITHMEIGCIIFPRESLSYLAAAL